MLNNCASICMCICVACLSVCPYIGRKTVDATKQKTKKYIIFRKILCQGKISILK